MIERKKISLFPKKVNEQKRSVAKAFRQRKKNEKMPAILEMLFVVVNRGKGDAVSNYLKEKGFYKISSYGLGTATSSLQSILGVHNEKEIVYCVIPVIDSDKLLNDLEEKFLTVEQYAGIAFTVPLKSITKDSMQKFIKE